MSTFGKGRCTVCGNLYALRKNGLVVSHPPYNNCPGGGLIPIDPATDPGPEMRAYNEAEHRARHWETRARHLEETLERIRAIPVQKGGVILASALGQAMGDE